MAAISKESNWLPETYVTVQVETKILPEEVDEGAVVVATGVVAAVTEK